MSPARADHVVIGQVLLAARGREVETAEAIGIAADRVVDAGDAREVRDAARPGARVTDASGFAVIPGLHDFHLHLVGMARARRAVLLDDARTFDEVLARVARAARNLGSDSGAWLTGRGWHEAALPPPELGRLEAAVRSRRVALTSHDGHSVWASAAARAAAGIDDERGDPPGGRIERGPDGLPNGILREAALLPVEAVKERLRGEGLRRALAECLAEMAALGITGATDAGDPDESGGDGELAELGDSLSTLAALADEIGPRLRLTLNLPAASLPAAARLGLRTGAALEGASLRIGWAKVYADGALGSRTAALFAPHTCGDAADTGLLRYTPDELAGIVRIARQARVRLAIHAIGDRAVATALDALQRDPADDGGPTDRIEHVQLIRASDRARLGGSRITASLQPIHAAADRDAVEACWADRQSDAYAWRSLADAGARLAFGSDAPIETVNPWHGLVAAVRRHAPGDGRSSWRAEEALTAPEALAAYTVGPAASLARPDEGHLRPGAVADLAVLDVSLAAVLEAAEEIGAARSQLTLVGGREVPLA